MDPSAWNVPPPRNFHIPKSYPSLKGLDQGPFFLELSLNLQSCGILSWTSVAFYFTSLPAFTTFYLGLELLMLPSY